MGGDAGGEATGPSTGGESTPAGTEDIRPFATAKNSLKTLVMPVLALRCFTHSDEVEEVSTTVRVREAGLNAAAER